MDYTSYLMVPSAVAPEVTYKIGKMSFGRRIELTQRIRELSGRKEFLEAGDTPNEQMDAALLASSIDRLYLMWGLLEVIGLKIDGAPATPESLTASGPEELFREALAAAKRQCGLSESERKN